MRELPSISWGTNWFILPSPLPPGQHPHAQGKGGGQPRGEEGGGGGEKAGREGGLTEEDVKVDIVANAVGLLRLAGHIEDRLVRDARPSRVVGHAAARAAVAALLGGRRGSSAELGVRGEGRGRCAGAQQQEGGHHLTG